MKNVLCILATLACSAGTGLLAQEAPASQPAPQENSSPSTQASAPPSGEQAQAPQPAPSVAEPDGAPTPATAPAHASEPAQPASPSSSADGDRQKIVEKLNQIIAAHADQGLGRLMKEVGEAFPDSASVSAGESTEIVNGQGSRVITVSVTEKDGTTSTGTFRKPLIQKDQPSASSDSDSGKGDAALNADASSCDEMAEGIIGCADRICDLLGNVRDKATADRLAPQVWEQSVRLEDLLTASRARRLSPSYLATLAQKYNAEIEARFDKMDRLVSQLSWKDYYGSSTLKRAAAQLGE